MEIKSILVELESINENVTYASSGILLNNKFVIVTANIFANLFKTNNDSYKKIFNWNKRSTNFIKPDDILANVPKLNIIINMNDNQINYRNGNIISAFVSNNIRDVSVRSLRDWSIDTEDDINVKNLLCLFFIISIDDGRKNDLDEFKCILRNYCDTLDDNFYVGKDICIESSPFGNRHFFNTYTRGIISNIVDNKECLILTDCTTTVGSEGGLVLSYSDRKPIGIVIASISWYKKEWVGLTLITKLQTLFAEMLNYNCDVKVTRFIGKFYEVLAKSAVRIICGMTWGSGILLNKEKGIFITNAHVVEDHDECTVHWKGLMLPSKIIYKADECDGCFDLAILRTDPELLKNTEIEAATFSNDKLRNGDIIYAIGFPLFPQDVNKCPTLTKGHVSKISASMLKTTSSVLGGSSGGGLYDSNGKLVGIIVANVKLEDNNVIYPRLNVAIPITAISQIIKDYFASEDVKVFENLRTTNNVGEKEWNLLTSKL